MQCWEAYQLTIIDLREACNLRAVVNPWWQPMAWHVVTLVQEQLEYDRQRSPHQQLQRAGGVVAENSGAAGYARRHTS